MKGDVPMRITVDRRPVVYKVSTSAAITQCVINGIVGIAGLAVLYLIWKEL